MIHRMLFFLFLIGHLAGSAQTPYPVSAFRSPLDTSMSLAGNFGEIRPNHFHAGFDLRTGNKEGLPVFAIGDGYVCRIKISPLGYGKAIYIRHPNGYTSVYGHLSVLKGAIGNFTKNCQYSKESFELDTLLPANLLRVSSGDTIALSGNTGGSQGPHLHFEIRESATEMPINPYHFGYLINDTIAPRINQLVVYPLTGAATVNGKNQLKKIRPEFRKNQYSYLKNDTVTVNGMIGFGISCYDRESGSTNQNGVYSVEVLSGGKRVYYYSFDKFSFENARYVNAHIDYYQKQKNREVIQKCFRSKNNELEIYDNPVLNGNLELDDDSVHWITFIVKDYAGNTTTLPLKVKSRSAGIKKEMAETAKIDCLKSFEKSSSDYTVKIPAKALYDDIAWTASLLPQKAGSYSKTLDILDETVALQKAIEISLPVSGLPDSLQSKACLVKIGPNGQRSYVGGKLKDKQLVATSKVLGSFRVDLDSIPPVLKPAFRIQKDSLIQDLSKSRYIGVKATDNLSGISSYRATVDGKWVLCEYETKEDLLFCPFDEHIPPGVHTFYLQVMDDRGNKSDFLCTFKL